MTKANIALIGCALLVAGLFAPILTLPFAGGINLFNDSSNMLAVAMLLLAIMAAGLAAAGRTGDGLWPGVAAGLLLAYLFVRLQFLLSGMRSEIGPRMAEGPFGADDLRMLGLVQLQWGWLVLATGTGLIIYAAVAVRKAVPSPVAEAEAPAGIGAEAAPAEADTGRPLANDNVSRAAVILSLLLLTGAIAWDLVRTSAGAAPAVAGDAAPPPGPAAANMMQAAAGPDRTSDEEAAYIRQHLRLYDLNARYFDSILDGRVPGVRFKIKNDGDRTLNRVTVRVVFQDAAGNPIAEEEYSPVLVSEYAIGDNDSPLRPNYIWQQDADRFYTAKGVPSEWATGRATATITDIEFAPD